MERADGLILASRRVRLEPLTLEHVPALVAAINEDPDSFRYSTAPDTESAMAEWVRAALDARDAGRELPFATYSSPVGFRIDARNDRSRSAVERLGAKFEAVRRAEQLGADGVVRDSAFSSILAAEWPAVKEGLISRLESRC
ncbi:MAG TPA: GNAT family N-acetyltransferase [Solirubrobacteraceae bacterium]|nr:GNAT family N-acetyltransferase [Solirubrobacteraceae bacterium]